MLSAQMQSRGRSRHVSPVAIARLASEERREPPEERRKSHRAQRLKACEKLWHDERRRREHDDRATTSRLEQPTKRVQEPFQYTFMQPSSSRPKPTKKASSHRSVSFKEVISAMNGKLFPLDPSERADDARRIAGLPIANPQKRKASVRAELLDSLLQVVEWQQGERRNGKGKDVDAPILSLVSLSSSRSSSWLSFGSWRSTATDITTPDSPVLSSPKHLLLPTLIDAHPRAAFVHIALEDSPLSPPLISASPPLHDFLTPSIPISIRGTLVNRVSRSVATIVEAAKGLQSAYISATMFAAGHPYQDTPQHHRPSPSQRHLRRQGYRALPKDVQRFTDATSPISQSCEPVHFIPLVSPTSANAGKPKPSVPKDVILFPSPLRPRTPPSALAYRMRPVANPAVLRLKALQNIMYARGKEWEGRARDGGLGCGKERMLGIAFEGRGPSGLGCEVRFVVA